MKHSSYILRIVWTALMAAGISSAHAFSIDPGVRVVSVKPGEKSRLVYELKNKDKKPLKLEWNVRDAYITKKNKAYPSSVWIKPLFKDLVVPAESGTKIEYEIDAPAAADGELAAILTFTKKATGETEGGAVGMEILPAISIGLYVRLEGTTKGAAELGTITVKTFPYRGTPNMAIGVDVEFINEGNVHLRPGGSAKLFVQGDKEPLYTFNFERGWPTMPETKGVYSAHDTGVLKPGRYVVSVDMDVESTHFVKTVNLKVDKSGTITYESSK